MTKSSRFLGDVEDAIHLSEFASPEACELYIRNMTLPRISLDDDIERLRAYYGDFDRERAKQSHRRFNVVVGKGEIAGVPVQFIRPGGGILQRNAQRVLINLHGGAFLWGRGDGGLAESIPIAATGSFKVVTVHYRLAPEHRFPAASEDVVAVYTELLNQYHSDSIGIYGTSAGGILTAQVIAWLHREGLPLPGAIGTFCGTGLEMGGDSLCLPSSPADKPPISKDMPVLRVVSLPYFRGAASNDPMVFPLAHEELTRIFPPTLLIAGGRDYAASSLTLAHRKLARAGRYSRLFLFDGLWHAFLVNPELPESSEAYSLICQFFTEHLL